MDNVMDNMNLLKWTEEQKNMIRDLIAEEIEKARLSHKFIPELKLAEDARSVSADELDSATYQVDDITTIPLVEIEVPINLTRLQAEDVDLSAALLLIRRAANHLARAHDAVVFAGQPGTDLPPLTAPTNVNAIGGRTNDGVSAITTSVDIGPLVTSSTSTTGKGSTTSSTATSGGFASYGEALVAGVANALVTLEGKGYIGSYVLVLGQRLFTDANTPSPGSLVLPTDRLKALLGEGPVHRSSVLDQDEGLLLSLGGEPMDRAVAVAPIFESLRIGAKDMRECRVFERFALRLKEKDSVIKLKRK